MENNEIYYCLNCGKQLSGRKRKFCSRACLRTWHNVQNTEKRREANAHTRKCIVCGKDFTIIGKSMKKTCSEECRAKHLSQYNSKYVKERRATDEEFAEKNRQLSQRTSSLGYARRQWQTWNTHAENILVLAKKKDAKVLIARYLDEHALLRKKTTSPTRKNQSEEELVASETLQSFGDLTSE